MRKQYARVDISDYTPNKKSKDEQDKIARLYGLAAKLGVKIGAEDGKGKEDRR